MKSKILKYAISALLGLVYTLPVWAEEGGEESYPYSPDSGDDVPIHEWQWLLVLFAISLGYYFIKRFQEKVMVS